MEVEVTTTAPETSTGESSAPISTTTAPVSGMSAEKPVGDVAPPAETPVYTPNFSYKAAGKDKEFPDWAKGLIKDAEMEKTLRELYERADGLDFVKQERGTIKQQLGQVQGEYQQLQGYLQNLGALKNNGDFRSLFHEMGINDDQILQYALKVAELREAPENIRRQDQEHWHATRRSRDLESENGQLQQQLEEIGVSTRTMELNMALQKPGVSEVAAAYDERVGQPGAFKDEVIARGKLLWFQSKVDAPVEQVISDLVQKYGWLQNTAPAAPVVAPQPAAQASAAEKKPVIPTIQGRGTSPVKKVPSSIADLKRIRDERTAGL